MTEQHRSITLPPQDLVRNWQFETGELTETPLSQVVRSAGAAAVDFLKQPGPIEKEMAHAIANEVNNLRDSAAAQNARDQKVLKNIAAVTPQNDAHKGALNTARRQIQTALDARGNGEPASLWESRPVVQAVTQELAIQEKEAVEKAIDVRIEADRLPWTMPNPGIPDEIIDILKEHYDLLTASPEPKPDDEFHVPTPMSMPNRYVPEDEALLTAAGVSPKSTRFTREALKKAGVFFINRVGEGEQPIFGMPIPDPESEGGVFNVQDRSFLTREEFDRVYKWQQANGYNIGALDPVDVQTDMFMAVMRPRSRDGTRSSGGVSARATKFYIMRSPFVDSGFCQNFEGVEGHIQDTTGDTLGEKTYRRINTLTIHLMNAHPDYPGVSETFVPKEVAWDQRYISPSEFVKSLYEPLPSREEALFMTANGLPTKREQLWVGRDNVTDRWCKDLGLNPEV
jgi:hypothetical protein